MTTILTKRSNTPGAVPVTANLTNAAGGAELAVNTADKRLFTLNSANNVVEVGTNPSSLTCADVSATVLRAGSGTITNLIATTAAITDFSATVARVGSLTISSLSLSNATVTSATITTLTGTSAGITTISSDSANITQLQSTSATITTLTSTSASVTNLTATSLVLSNLSITSANVTTLTSASATITNLINTSASITTLTNNPTFSAGTANGVLYLNGSKVATSGSALQFSGTKLSLSAAGGADFVGLFTNTTAATPYILRVQEPATPTSGYPLLDVVNNAGSTAYLRVDSGTGNVGIGTASPGSKLDVRGANSNNLSDLGAQIVNSIDTTAYAQNNGGGIGFGYVFNSGGSVIGRAAVIKAVKENATDGNYATSLVFANAANSSNTIEKMRLDSAGNLGIGTASPAYKLDVNRGSSGVVLNLNGVNAYDAETGITFSEGRAKISGFLNSSGGTPGSSLRFYTMPDGGSITERGRFMSNGEFLVGNTTNYGVGSAENNSVQVKGPIVLAANNTGSASNRNWIMQTNSAAAGSFSLAYSSTNTGWPNAAYALTITSSGNATVNGSVTAGKQDYSFQAIQRALTLNGDGVSGVYPLNSWRFYTTPGTIQTNQLLSIRAQDDTNGETGDLLSLTSTGNLCISVAPSNWSGTLIKAVQVANNGASISSFTTSNTTDKYFYTTNNAYYDGTNWKYFGTKPAAQYLQLNDIHKWYGVVQGTADTNITWGDPKMTLDASGNLGVGTTNTTPANGEGMCVGAASTITRIDMRNSTTGDASGDGTSLYLNGNDFTVENRENGFVAFATNNTERGRFTAGGYFKASNSGTYVSSTDPYHELRKDQDNSNPVVRIQAQQTTATNQNAIDIHLNGDPNNSTNYFIYGYGGGGPTQRFTMRSNGGLANYQTNDANLSDERTKKDIAPLGSMWAKIKALEIVTFKYKDQTHDDDNIGLIAQQVESVAPEFVDVDGWGETPEDGVPLKSIYTADMYHAAIKALQEAMARIESLEADVAALKGAK